MPGDVARACSGSAGPTACELRLRSRAERVGLQARLEVRDMRLEEPISIETRRMRLEATIATAAFAEGRRRLLAQDLLCGQRIRTLRAHRPFRA